LYVYWRQDLVVNNLIGLMRFFNSIFKYPADVRQRLVDLRTCSYFAEGPRSARNVSMMFVRWWIFLFLFILMLYLVKTDSSKNGQIYTPERRNRPRKHNGITQAGTEDNKLNPQLKESIEIPSISSDQCLLVSNNAINIIGPTFKSWSKITVKVIIKFRCYKRNTSDKQRSPV